MADLQQRLAREIDGDVLFDDVSLGQYSTDASIYQVKPIGIAIPRTAEDALRALEIAADAGVAILPRGAGTSQCGQAVGEALIIDNSKHLGEIENINKEDATVWVEPGVVLDHLNAWLKPHGLWYPVDVSTSAQATIGGMTANNSCGARSIRYGNMVHNVLAAEAWLTHGESVEFGAVSGATKGSSLQQQLVDTVRRLYVREHEEIAARVPAVQRKVAGYNLDLASADSFNMAHLLVGSEGTLGYFRRIKLQLAPLPPNKVLGIVHFPTFYEAMDKTQHIVTLDPAAVELVDRNMIELSRRNPAFQGTVDASVRGDPDAILLVEFAGDDHSQQVRKLDSLCELMADHGLPDSVVRIEEPGLQKAVWSVRKAGLNIMMSMKGDGKPVSFIEDCAVPLEHLADYTARLSEVFAKHGTKGTFYAHASVGCLHVRPVLNMREEEGAIKMRAIAEEACAMVQEYKGSYSGEHGDGLVRSEWIERMYGPRLTRAFEELKQAFDPKGLMNPGKIVSPASMDDRSLFRFKPGYRTPPVETGMDWSEHEVGEHNHGRGFAAAVEMCNNNGHCRKFDAGLMCPSYRVTRNERDLTRGRANSLRLALSGQLGPEGLNSDELFRTMELCVSCKGCKRECPTGVDMAAMKIEFLHQYYKHNRRPLKDRLVANLPRYAPRLSRFPGLANLRDRVPGLAGLSEKLTGLSAKRRLPAWRRDAFRGQVEVPGGKQGNEVVLFADTFNRWFEPENLRAAVAVLTAAGYRTIVPEPVGGGRPLCCGRTYLASGMIDEAREEAQRVLDALGPYIAAGLPVVGLEPSCLLGTRDEFMSILPGNEAEALAESALTFDQFLVRENEAGRLNLALKPTRYRSAC
jgi:FAD/FMN-containing dehydrogenase/Fe-S oxidoreductase